ncbi:uncharacterized protein LOC119077625 [Bradysia coprophila]|uniref:uncharacterized protein LOC119077625 n=1 Tax=Bradysia coprophila TaxID=38358 RepID=UPI00187DAC00|nr:uncharacterized protein LOC119077625 [Bradysia coprophila]
MTTDSTSVDALRKNQLNDFQHEALENSALLSDVSTVNSREFIEKTDDILASTSKLTINLLEKDCCNEPFTRNGVKSVFHILNREGEHVFTIGQCPASHNVQSTVISNSVGYGVMSFTTSGIFNKVCDVDGAGLLSFTQIQHFHGGYTLRDPYKDLVKIRSGWIPFCTCCLNQISSTSMTITDLDGTHSGSIVFEKLNSALGGNTLSINFIPNLNAKAKYMLLAASIRLISVYFS